jgi:hypothetical protein
MDMVLEYSPNWAFFGVNDLVNVGKCYNLRASGQDGAPSFYQEDAVEILWDVPKSPKCKRLVKYCLRLCKSMGYPNSWLVCKGKSQHKMDDLGVPPFMETSIWTISEKPMEFRVPYVQTNSNRGNMIWFATLWLVATLAGKSDDVKIAMGLS